MPDEARQAAVDRAENIESELILLREDIGELDHWLRERNGPTVDLLISDIGTVIMSLENDREV